MFARITARSTVMFNFCVSAIIILVSIIVLIDDAYKCCADGVG